MSELHSNIYFKHENKQIHDDLAGLFKILSSDEDEAVEIAEKINPEHGEDLLNQLLYDVDDKYGDSLYPETVDQLANYYCVHLVNGGSGDYIAGRVVKFLYELCPDIHSQAWGCGDDDPWEYWFRFVDGKIIRCDSEPLMDDEDDVRIKGTVYRWWHEEMPKNIQQGFLNNQNDEDDEETLGASHDAVSDAEYQEWLSGLYKESESADKNDLAAQGIESPISKDDVQDIVGSLGDLFSMVLGAAKADKNPQVGALDATEVTETLVMQAFNDLEKEEGLFNLDGVLKHMSKKMKGHVEVIDETFSGKVPMTYGMYKMGMAMILKPKSKYQSKSTIQSFEMNNDGTANLFFEADAQFIDPETRKLTRSVSENKFVWSIVDGKLLVTGMQSKELKKEILE